MKFAITTLGCPKNTVDSAHLEEALLSEGFESVEDPGASDIILVNTCGFIRDATEESIGEILRLANLKKDSGSRGSDKGRESAGATTTADDGKGRRKLAVFGCLVQRYGDELIREMPEIDALWGVNSDEKIVEYCKTLRDSRESKDSQGSGSRESTTDDSGLRTQYSRFMTRESRPLASSYAYLKIAEGCNKRCTFCVIPSIRGAFRSAAPEALRAEAETHIRRGVRELILVAQDITDYGRDLKGYGLVPLLRGLASIEGDFRIRLLYLYPTAVSDELLDFMASEKKVIDYLDIPLQHSEDRLLRLMGRRGTRKDYLKLIRKVRRAIPGVTLRTTFIVGFPTETEDDFNGLVDFIEEVRFDRLGAFAYSREEGTAAALLKGQIPEKVKQRRFEELMKRQSLISLEKNRELIGQRFEALIEEVEGRLAIGRIGSQAPEIDGVTIIEESAVSSQQSAVGSQATEVESRELRVQRHGAGGNGEESGVVNRESRDGIEDTAPEPHPALAVGDMVTVEIVDAYDYDLQARPVAGTASVSVDKE